MDPFFSNSVELANTSETTLPFDVTWNLDAFYLPSPSPSTITTTTTTTTSRSPSIEVTSPVSVGPTLSHSQKAISGLDEKEIPSQRKKDDKINSFIFNLYKLLADPTCQGYIFWCPNGKEFGFVSNGEFGMKALAKHYRSNNEQSFTRQLNMYGFTRVTRQVHPSHANILIYRHPYFVRGRVDLLCKIKRKEMIPVTDPLQDTTPLLPMHSELCSNVIPPTQVFDHLKQRVHALELSLVQYQQQLLLQRKMLEQFYSPQFIQQQMNLPPQPIFEVEGQTLPWAKGDMPYLNHGTTNSNF